MIALVPAMIDAPVLTDAFSIAPLPNIAAADAAMVAALPAEAPSIDTGPAILSTIGSQKAIPGPSLPLTVHGPAPAAPASPSPPLSRIGTLAPRLNVPPKLAVVADVAPSLPPAGALKMLSKRAPQINAAPAMVDAGQQLASVMRVTPSVSRVGTAAPRLPRADIAVRTIGPKVVTDVSDDTTERSLQDVIVKAAEEAARVVQASNDQRRALDRLVLAVASERHYLTPRDGRHVVDPSMLDRFGLTDADIVAAPIQQQFAQIAEQQNAELVRIHAYISGTPHHLRNDNAGWALDVAAPADIRALVAAWRINPTFQTALRRFTDAAPPFVTAAAVSDTREAPAISAWQKARAYRDRAMAEWDATERLDGGGMARPGMQIERPGSQQAEALAPAVRRRPPGPGYGFGD